ncbi:MAG: PKD domain-containing protein, partial [Psychrosphaera sp.]|nr:PKD domain-containing protein [Psychrosphaera sp.]
MIHLKILCSIVLLLSLVGCGGGGGGGGGSTTPGPVTPPPATNNQPIANAGSNQTIVAGDTVNLSGASSSDIDGDNLSYTWQLNSKPAGSNATFTDANSVTATFIADVAGSYVVSLTVNDGQVSSSASTVTITAIAANNPPIADAGPDQQVEAGQTVTLSGSTSQDPDGDSLTYRWQFNARPDGSVADLSDPTSQSPTFTADVAGTYSFALTVNDGQIDSAPDTVTVEVVPLNTAPIANAGTDNSTIVGATVSLSGAASSDTDGDPLIYAWQFNARPDGSEAVLSNSNIVSPTFIPDLPGGYTIALVVNDGQLNSTADT